MGNGSSSGDTAGWLGLAGGLISSAGQIYVNYQNQKANEKRWKKSIELANTAHQREVEDLRAAGLNPILSADGSGASVPSLGIAEQGNIGEGLGDGISSASKYLSEEYKANVKNLQSTNEGLELSNSAKQIENDILDNERVVSDYQTKADIDSAQLDQIDKAARHEALTGVRTIDRDLFKGSKYSKQYKQLVNTYKRQIRTGEYDSSVGHSYLRDAGKVVDLVGGVASSAKGFKGLKSAPNQRRVRIRSGYRNKNGAYYEKETVD